MGATSGDTRREVEALRGEISAIVDELDRRGRAMLGTPSHVAHHPATRGAMAASLSVMTGVVAYGLAGRLRARREEQVNDLARPLTRTQAAQQRWRQELRAMLDRFPGHVPGRPAGRMRNATAQAWDTEESRMLKRLLWAATTALMMAFAGMVARRVSAMLWERAMHEKPPGQASEAKV